MQLRGRVVDVRTSAEGDEVVVLAEDRLHVVRPRGGVTVAPGRFVRVRLEADGHAALEPLDGPEPSPIDAAGDVLRWRRLGEPVTRMERLRRRHEILRAIRDDLHGEGFLEVQTPLLARGGCPDLHIDSFEVGDGRYLVTSTEYQLKRMIAGGFDRVFTLTQNFRRGEVGDHHNPEFTMLEWARAFETLAAIEDDAERFVRRALAQIAPGVTVIERDGRTIDLGARWERLSVRDALARYLGVEVAPDFTLASMQAGCARAGLTPPAGSDESALTFVSYLLVELQPHLGRATPTFLRDWPSFMTSSAGLVPGAPWLAERSELYIAGIEIADGFPSLRDPALQRETFARELDKRRAAAKETVGLDERYLVALDQGLPPGAGMALGVDRLVMVLTGAHTLRDVMPFAWDEL